MCAALSTVVCVLLLIHNMHVRAQLALIPELRKTVNELELLSQSIAAVQMQKSSSDSWIRRVDSSELPPVAKLAAQLAAQSRTHTYLSTDWNETDPDTGEHIPPAHHRRVDFQKEPHSWKDCMKFRCSRAARCHIDRVHNSSALADILTDVAALRKPCCADLLVLQLVELSSLLSQYAVPHAIVWGALLGSLRINDVIPWTADGDVAIPPWGVNKLIQTQNLTGEGLNHVMMAKGFVIMVKGMRMLWEECASADFIHNWRSYTTS